MSRQTIDTTSGAGDTGKAGGDKINANFAELYGMVAFDPIPFATAIGFTASAYMPRRQVGGALAFTRAAAGALVGAEVAVELVADGTNMPTFTGFKEWGGSSGYLNTSGMVNMVRFVFTGLEYLYSVNQVVNPVPAPRLASAAAATTQNTIALTFSKSLNAGQVPAASAFAVMNSAGAQAVTGVSISGAIVTLTTNRTNAAGNVITVSYTPPTANALVSTDGEFAGGFASYSVTLASATPPANSVAPALSTTTPSTGSPITVTSGTWSGSPTYAYQWKWADTGADIANATNATYTPAAGDIGHTLRCVVTATNGFGSTSQTSNTSSAVVQGAAYLRFPTMDAGAVETANSSGGWDYGATDDTGNSFGSGYGAATTTTKIAAATSTASFTLTFAGFKGVSDGIFVALRANGAASAYSDTKFGIYASGGGGNYAGWGTPTAVTAVTAAPGDQIRMRKASSSIFAEVCKDGTTWVTAFRWDSIVQEDLYATVICNATRQAVAPTHAGFA